MWLSKTPKRGTVAAPKLKTPPPTSEAFIENVKRAHYQCAIWKSALKGEPPDLDPCDYGWSKDECSSALLPITLPHGVPRIPEELMSMMKCGCASENPCVSGRCPCKIAGIGCNIFCNCNVNSIICGNKFTEKDNLDECNEEEDDDDESGEIGDEE